MKVSNYCITYYVGGERKEEVYLCKKSAIHFYIDCLWEHSISGLKISRWRYKKSIDEYVLEDVTSSVNRFLQD